MRSVDYRDLLGKKWELRARGPERFDCLGLVYEVLLRTGVELDELARLEDYEDEPAAWRMLSDWPGRSRWKLLGHQAHFASQVGDVLYSVPSPTVHHVSVVVWSDLPRIALTTTLRRGVHALPVHRIPDVAAVYRLIPLEAA